MRHPVVPIPKVGPNFAAIIITIGKIMCYTLLPIIHEKWQN